MTTSRDDDDTVVEEPVDHTAQAVQAMLAAVAIADKDGQDFAEWLSHCLATVAAMSGGMHALIAGRPGSWESGKVLDFLQSTVGDDDGLAAYLPDDFRPPVGSVALYESADNTLWLVTRPWDGSDARPATVYVRNAGLGHEDSVEADGRALVIEHADLDWRWRRLSGGDVAEAILNADDLHTGNPAPGVLLGTVYRDRTAYGVGDDAGGVYFDVIDQAYLDSRPLPVQRYCQTINATDLEETESEAMGKVLDELAVLAGELSAEDLAAGIYYGTDPEDRGSVALLYATALGLARNDDERFARAQQIKADWDAWYARWHHLYTDAQPAGTPPLGL